MNYEQFIAEIQKYWDLRSKGLKKQANNFLFEFTRCFKEDVSEDAADVILFQFCREYIDEMKFPGTNLPRRHLPFQMTELLNSYLIRECEKIRCHRCDGHINFLESILIRMTLHVSRIRTIFWNRHMHMHSVTSRLLRFTLAHRWSVCGGDSIISRKVA